jgi:hypothetical protein
MPKLSTADIAIMEQEPWWPAELRRPAPEPEPPAKVVEIAPVQPASREPDPVALALRLLREIAEEPFISGRFRMQARRHFRQLEKLRARAAAEGLAAPEDGEPDEDEGESDWAAA